MSKTIQNGGFTNPLGQALTGNLLLILSQDAKVAASPNQVAPIATRIAIAGGNIAPTSIYFNDELLPNNTYYTMTAYDAAGNKTYGPEQVSLTGAGPLDLGTLVPLLISPDPLFSNPVLQNPVSPQTITGQPLTLTSTVPLTVQGTATFTAPMIGLTTNTQWNGVNTLNPAGNSVNFNTEYQFGQGAFGASELLSIGLSVPSTATAKSVNTLGIYTNSSSSTGTFSVGLYVQNRALAASTKIEAINPIVEDNNFAATAMAAAEFDCNVQNIATNGECVQISGSFAGKPTNFPAMHISAPAGGGSWSTEILRDSGGSPYFTNTGTGAGIAPEALNVNTGSSGNLYFTIASGNLGVQHGFSGFGGGNNFQWFLQARNNVGANNTAYPIMLNPLGGPVCVNTQSATNCAPNGTGVTIGSGSGITSSGSGGTVATLAGVETLTNKMLNVPLSNGTGLQIFNTTTTCTTAASVGATCTTAAISLPVAEADTNYRITCTGKGPTAVPVVSSIANSSATQFTITIAALTAVVASFSSYDCIVGHN